MKKQPKDLEETGREFDSKRFWRHYVANVDVDPGWGDEAPRKGRTSNRVFLFLLLFHVFLIASVVLFNLVSDRPKPVFVDNSIPARKTTTTAKPVAGTEAGKQTPTAPVITAAKGGETVEHRVVQGESMKSIADKYGTVQDEIAKLNQLEISTPVRVGSVLQVPKPKDKAPPAIIPPAVQPSRVEEKIIAVQTTTAPSTAQMFAAVEPAPSPKKAEMVPAPAPAPKAETIQSKPPQDKPKVSVADSPPAEKFKPTEAKGPAKSETPKPTETKAQVRQEAPKPTETKAVVRTESPKPASTNKPAVSKTSEPAKPVPKASTGGSTHTVKPKETLYSISRKHGVNVNELMKLNNISDPSKLREGVVLKVPK